MAWRRLLADRGTIASLVAAGLLLASGCVSDGDSQATFDPVGDDNTGATSGASSGSGGSKVSGAGTSSSGAHPSAGSSAGGTDSGNAGTDTGGTDAGGTGTGGTGTGGTDMGGTDMGGSAGSGGSQGGSSAGAGGSPSGGGGVGGKAGAGGGPSCTPGDEVCDGVDNDCDKLADPEGTCPSGCTGATYGGHVYYFCGVVDSASAALSKCAGYGMAMVGIQTKEENAFVIGKLAGTSWLGASDEEQESEWRWISTSAMFWDHGAIDGQYHNWVLGEPDNDGPNGADQNCAVIQAPAVGLSRGFWSDVSCDAGGYRATCESTASVIGPLPF